MYLTTYDGLVDMPVEARSPVNLRTAKQVRDEDKKGSKNAFE